MKEEIERNVDKVCSLTDRENVDVRVQFSQLRATAGAHEKGTVASGIQRLKEINTGGFHVDIRAETRVVKTFVGNRPHVGTGILQKIRDLGELGQIRAGEGAVPDFRCLLTEILLQELIREDQTGSLPGEKTLGELIRKPLQISGRFNGREDQIESVISQIAQKVIRAAVHQENVDVGPFLPELRQDFRKAELGAHGRDSDAERSVVGMADRGKAVDQIVVFTEHLLGGEFQGLPGRCQPKRWLSLEERHAVELFQIPDLEAERLLGEIETPGGPGHIQIFAYFQKIPETVQIHGLASFRMDKEPRLGRWIPRPEQRS